LALINGCVAGVRKLDPALDDDIGGVETGLALMGSFIVCDFNRQGPPIQDGRISSGLAGE